MNDPKKKVLLVREDLSECRLIVELIDEPSAHSNFEEKEREEEERDECAGQ